ncbi:MULTISPECIES: tryptophan--tRNA ligase [unclassified Snodgrassella]|uniref:tryptophan--tRNA ligase n=1 Tax=unclassified Snodgrassella TaxID=2625236 RepID=UPI0018DBB6E1|nr:MULTISPECIES: tryptophan--tRNA ligase [unclassified Snodgrassella]MBI0097286.1 tryptophan--tRNA ligase [Snodgrassella sp. W8134]MBI0100981.1 tryptophan--tRNA ligase [Snodgrassella sp. W8135]
MKKIRVLTGVTPSGIPHLGNYVGAIRPAIQASMNSEVESFLFLSDYHALIKCHEPEKVHESTKAVAATWLACGLDPERTTFYRQTDIPEVMELNWILTCNTAKGLMNRAHAYKAAVQENAEKGQEDPDHGVEMGLFCYPMLMSADILMFNADKVPVGRDQIQHLEMARDIAGRFNHRYKPLFTLPEAQIDDNVETLVGLDGRKMSKSYGNTIPLFESEKKLQKAVNKIVTNLKEPGEAKQPDESPLFDIYKAFSTPAETLQFTQMLADGLAWGEAKKILAAKINEELAEKRERFEQLNAQPSLIEDILQAGAVKASQTAKPLLEAVREAVGIRSLK